MKPFLVFLLMLLAMGSRAQHCYCASMGEDERGARPCRKVRFSNGATLYWQYDCSDDWLMYESPSHRKKEIYSMQGLGFSPGQIGFYFDVELKRTFLLTNKVISGCCEPLEIRIFDKATGRQQRNVGPVLYYTRQPRYPFVVFFSKDYKTVNVLNVDRNKTCKIPFPVSRLDILQPHAPEMLFLEPVFTNGKLRLTYRYKHAVDDEQWLQDTIRIDLKKYQ